MYDSDEEVDESLAGKFEQGVDQIVEIRRSIFEGVCDQIKSVSNQVMGRSDDDEDSQPSFVCQVVDIVNGVDQTIVDGTANVVKNIGRAVLGIF